MKNSNTIQVLLFCITSLPAILLFQNCSPAPTQQDVKKSKSINGGTVIESNTNSTDQTSSSECILFGDCGGANPICAGTQEKFSVPTVPKFNSKGVITRISKVEAIDGSKIVPIMEKTYNKEFSIYAPKDIHNKEFVDVTFEHIGQDGRVIDTKLKRYQLSKSNCAPSSSSTPTSRQSDLGGAENAKPFEKNSPCDDFKKGDLIEFNGELQSIANIIIENPDYPWFDFGNNKGETCRGPYSGTDATIVGNTNGSCSSDATTFNHNDPCSLFQKDQKICYLGQETIIQAIVNPSSDYPYVQFTSPVNGEKGKSCKKNS